eukprot:UN05163
MERWTLYVDTNYGISFECFVNKQNDARFLNVQFKHISCCNTHMNGGHNT